ncbi:endolytic transglycosylase MltG [Arthrobacter sp. I2-34]|uniref:Endolytic murein transglycosylase n=1 Tax=Arthrobacter hankyongi TaxID=2904801 RepID=A0ABS9LD81_9MICC|nr:endolytic transglycosylase MltG [Arthrobacter hankyongi]MCG2624638.1 endolytic transglycosylase MltG [Arthrobacter hankyongi]
MTSQQKHRTSRRADAPNGDEGLDLLYRDRRAARMRRHSSAGSRVRPAARSRRPLTARQRRRRRGNIILLSVLGVFAAGLVALVLVLQNLLGMHAPKDFAGPGGQNVTFTVEQGAGPIAIAANLTEKDIVASDKLFLDELANQAKGREIQPGNYTLKLEMPAKDAVKVLLADAGAKVAYAAINRTLRQNEVFQALSEGTRIPVSDFEALAADPQKFGLPKQAHNLEGYLFPGEYRFPLDATAEEILKEMVGNTFARLEEDGITDADEQFRVLTIASIVEAEAGEADYPTVAGAIMNRLAPDNKETFGLIQSDATVTYGLNRKSYDITPEEKADKANKYNTYAHPGLPAGPINSPGGPAIDAAAHPKKVPYYYWVTVNLDSGETKFARTLAEHESYTKEYQKWCAGQEAGRCS